MMANWGDTPQVKAVKVIFWGWGLGGEERCGPNRTATANRHHRWPLWGDWITP